MIKVRNLVTYITLTLFAIRIQKLLSETELDEGSEKAFDKISWNK